ncbi:MAG: dipicolinate synthase subunit B [Clostridia bacterium]|nr:dipicolinate synthase subunit B [Clostridia bacterium]
MGIRAGFAVTGSFCTFDQTFAQLPELIGAGFEILPIMSEAAYSTDTRFGTAKSFIELFEQIAGRSIVHTINDAEPIGPKALLDILIIAPCTGNTLGKLAGGITDTAVTMAAKAHLRNQRPVVIAVASNDALAASARNIGQLMNAKNIYFVPMRQDDFVKKPTSMVAEMGMLLPTVRAALEGRQIQPIYIS